MAYNALKPAATDFIADSDALIRENFRALKEDAIVDAGTIEGYTLSQVLAPALNSDPLTSDISQWTGGGEIVEVTNGLIGTTTGIKIDESAIIYSLEFPIIAGRNYHMSVNVRRSSDGPETGVIAPDFIGGGLPVGYSMSPVNTPAFTTSWTNYNCTITAAPTATSCRIKIGCIITIGYLEFQDFKFRECESGNLLEDWSITYNKLAASAVALHGQQLFETDGTFTVPLGVTTLHITASAGGGGGGGGSNTYLSKLGHGGLAGNFIYKNIVNVLGGNVLSIVIGPGGEGGISSETVDGTDGTNGGDTTIVCVAASIDILLVGGAKGTKATMSDGANPEILALGKFKMVQYVISGGTIVGGGGGGNGGMYINGFPISGADGGQGFVLIEW